MKSWVNLIGKIFIYLTPLGANMVLPNPPWGHDGTSLTPLGNWGYLPNPLREWGVPL